MADEPSKPESKPQAAANARHEVAAEAGASDSPGVFAGGTVYGPFVKSFLDYEQTRKTSLEAKAAAIITTSGTLVTLLFGLAAVITGATGFVLPGTTHGWLVAAIVLFATAAGIGLAVSVIPVPYGELKFKPSELEGAWDQPAQVASVFVAQQQIEQIEVAKKWNDTKALLVILGGVAELLALLMLTFAVVLLVASSQTRGPSPSATTTTTAPAAQP